MKPLMKKALREKYLHEWSSYPQYLTGVGGRVLAIVPDGLLIEFEDECLKIKDLGIWKVAIPNFQHWGTFSLEEMTGLFSPGDWVCFQNNHHSESTSENVGYLQLVAPCLRTDFVPFSYKPEAKKFFHFLDDVALFFKNSGFTQVETPHLVVCPGLEPTLAPFKTQVQLSHQTETRFLPTSPELHLKKMLCRGYRKIFEIKKVFRNNEEGIYHEPEFLMLEWYRSFARLQEIQNDIELLIRHLISQGWVKGPLATQPFLVKTVSELFFEHFRFELKPETSKESLIQLAKDQQLEVALEDSWDDIFYRLFVTFIEPQFSNIPFLFLKNYPPSQAALARLNGEGWADRMEFYINGIEIANGFNELNDPKIQKLRFLEEQKLKRSLGMGEVPVDEEFLQHLEMGMPPSSGIAMGMERLSLALQGLKKIQDLLEFPYESGSRWY